MMTLQQFFNYFFSYKLYYMKLGEEILLSLTP